MSRPRSATPRVPVRTPRRLRILSKKSVHPSSWNAEVVSALCTRLPGGRTSVTTPCATCQSLFYPCLCSTKTWRRTEDYECDLKAPRVVDEAEKIRMQKGAHRMPAGNLALVIKSQDVSGLDKNRIHVLGCNTPGKEKLTSKAGSVVRRDADTYVMVPDDAKPYRQRLKLNKVELDGLLRAVHRDKMMIQEGGQIREVTVRYERPPTEKDLKLQVKSNGVFVHKVYAEGHAIKGNVGPGHMVTALCHDDDGVFEEVDYHDLPDCLLRHPTHAPGAVEVVGIWPLIITFDVLPPGWRILGHGPENNEKMFENIEALVQTVKEAMKNDDCELELLFEIDHEEEVSRYGFFVRHEYAFEKEDNQAMTEEQKKAALEKKREQNAEIFREWGVGARMTATQVSFAFERLIEEISDQLRRFDEQKDNFRRMLDEKCKRCVETRKRHEMEKKKGEYPNPAEITTNEREVQGVCDEVPLCFLREMQKEAAEEAEKKEMDTSTSRKTDESKIIHPWEVWEEMNKQISSYVEAINNKSKSDTKPKKGKKHQSTEHSANKMDGRLTPAEFEKCLYNAGISWLDRRDIREKFDAMDTDKSGKLNLGEVLSAATRMMELVKQAQIWGREQEDVSRKKVPHEQLLTLYAQYLEKTKAVSEDRYVSQMGVE